MLTSVTLNELLTRLADLPARRADLLAQLPGALHASGGLNAAISVPSRRRMRVIATNPAGPEARSFLPDDGPEYAAFRSDAPAVGHDEGDAGGRPLLALPLRERGSVIAVLGVRGEQATSPPLRQDLEVFAQLVSARLTDISHRLQLDVSARLVAAMDQVDTEEEFAPLALQAALANVTGASAIMLQRTGDVMCSIATFGEPPDEERAAILGVDCPYPHGLAWEACLTGERRLLRDPDDGHAASPGTRYVTLVQPVGRDGTYRWAIVIRIPKSIVGTPADRELFDSLCIQLAMAFEQLQFKRVQKRLLALQMLITDSDTSDLYQRILEAACELVPGANCGSLQVRDSPVDPFRFSAMVGFDTSRYRDIRLSESEVRRWYHEGDDGWREGRIRRLDASQIDFNQLGGTASRGNDRIRVPGVDAIKANLCMPVAYKGDVLAVMDLDSTKHEAAFGPDSMAVLQQFAAPVASMLAAAHQRDRVVAASRTDDLTDLPNRRASDLALATELARAQRTGEPFTVFVMDLRHFKSINDSYGHGVGDDTLREVARRLAASARMSDIVARWGGDEFAALLPGTGAEEAGRVAQRLREAVKGLVVGKVQLDINIGMATYPDDGVTANDLLRIADHRMYAEKQGPVAG